MNKTKKPTKQKTKNKSYKPASSPKKATVKKRISKKKKQNNNTIQSNEFPVSDCLISEIPGFDFTDNLSTASQQSSSFDSSVLGTTLSAVSFPMWEFMYKYLKKNEPPFPFNCPTLEGTHNVYVVLDENYTPSSHSLGNPIVSRLNESKYHMLILSENEVEFLNKFRLLRKENMALHFFKKLDNLVDFLILSPNIVIQKILFYECDNVYFLTSFEKISTIKWYLIKFILNIRKLL